MTRTILRLVPLALALLAGCQDHELPLDPEAGHPLAAAGGPHVVNVAPPTGVVAQDRASILAALDEVRPGGTIQFAPGEYLIGTTVFDGWEFIPVTAPRITLLGHPQGTTLRGCDWQQWDWGACVGLELSGGQQTVRNLHFEGFTTALVLGKFLYLGPAENRVGGYHVEDNSFRDIEFTIMAYGKWSQPAIIRNNALVDVFVGVVISGRNVHVVDNDFSVLEPRMDPLVAIGVEAWDDIGTGPCDHNVIARNRIDGYSSGVVFFPDPNLSCRYNRVSDNSILNSEIWWGGSVALALDNSYGEPANVEHNLFVGNRVRGVVGTGMMILGGSGIQVVNNTFSGITPHPSNFFVGNGSGVWVSPGSSQNQLLANTFTSVEGYEVVLEGDYNHVATTRASDVVRDLGIGNRVTGPGSVVTTSAPVSAGAGAVAASLERTEVALTIRERFGPRRRLLEEMRREAAPR